LTVIAQVIRSFFWDLRGRWKQILKKSLFSRLKTILVNFPSYYRVWKTSGNNLLGSTRSYSYHCARYEIISVTLKMLSKIQFFLKESFFAAKKKCFSRVLLVLSSMKNLREQFKRVQNVFWQFLHKLKDHFSSTYEVDGNNFWKKISFPDEKQFWSIFSRNTLYGRPQKTIY